MVEAQAADANDYKAAAVRGAEKLELAAILQLWAFGTVFLFVYLERNNSAWGTPVKSVLGQFKVAYPLYGMLWVGLTITVLGSLVALGMARSFLRVVISKPDELNIVRTANRTIFIFFALDTLCLLIFMFMSKGAAGFLSLFLTIVAVMTVFTAPCNSILEPCRHCQWARNLDWQGQWKRLRFFVWLVRPLWIFQPSGWCVWIAIVGLGAYALGVSLSGEVAARVAEGQYATYLATSPGGVSLEAVTMLVFGVLGALQFVFVKYTREV